MKKLFIISFALALILPSLLYSQQPGFYRVSFTDKNNSPYSVSNPLDFLSQRALTRRADQGIPVTMQDIPINPSYIQGLKASGAQVVNESKWFNSAIVTLDSITQYTSIMALAYVDTVEFVAPPMIKSTGPDKFEMEMLLQQPAYNAESQSKGVIDYGLADNQATMIAVDYLHDLGYSGRGMHIAVIDAGFTNADITPVFDSVWNDNRILGHKDFGEIGGNIFSAHTHGTMVFSIMGANIPGQMVGTAPYASYWLLRSEVGSFEYIVEEDNWVAAAEFADSAGVDVINSSLGYTEFYDPGQSHSYENMDGNTTRVTRGADIAASKGMLIINSAGNSGSSSWNYIGAPADGDSVLTIGAVDAFGYFASFSSKGPTYDGRIKPDVAAQGQGTTFGDPWGSISAGNGTSFSSPVMAGAAACLWQAFPNFTNIEIMNAIRQSASQYTNPDTLLGYGIPNFAAAASILGGIDSKNPIQPGLIQAVSVSQGALHVTFNADADDGVLQLYDVQGKLLLYSPVSQFFNGKVERIPIRSLSSGIYLLRLSTKSGATETFKVSLP